MDANTIERINDKKIGFFVHEKYYLRSNAPATCSILYCQHDRNICEINIVITGGYYGVIAFDWGARDHMESNVAESIIKHAVEKLKLEKIGDKTIIKREDFVGKERRKIPMDAGQAMKHARNG